MIDNHEQSTEEQILQVAERLFLENGYALTSTTDIAKVVGCNQALIHYYYRTKENLFNIIFELKFKEFFQRIVESNKSGEIGFVEKIKSLVESHFELMKKNPKLPLLIINELQKQPKLLNNFKELIHNIPGKLHAQLEAELKVEIAAGRVREINITNLLLTIISLNISLFLLIPFGKELFELSDEQKNALIEQRKIEHVNIILNNLRPY